MYDEERERQQRLAQRDQWLEEQTARQAAEQAEAAKLAREERQIAALERIAAALERAYPVNGWEYDERPIDHIQGSDWEPVIVAQMIATDSFSDSEIPVYLCRRPRKTAPITEEHKYRTALAQIQISASTAQEAISDPLASAVNITAVRGLLHDITELIAEAFADS